MTRNISRETAQNSLDKKLDVPKIFYGWLGNNDDVVDVPGRVNYVYVKMTDGMVTQAYNVVVPSILNLPVICGYDQNQLSSGLLKVLSVRNVPRQTPNSTNPGSTLVSHHKSHEWMNADGGQDVTLIELRQYMPLRPSIIEPYTIRIERGVVRLAGVWKYIPSQTIDLSGSVPTTSEYGLSGSAVLGRYSLISLEAVSGSPAVTSGSLVPITQISLSDIPATPDGNFPICAVFSYYYQEKIIEARTRTDLIDLRYGMFDNTGTISTLSHNDLLNIQGGGSDERYHLTAEQHAIATQASGSGQDGYLTSNDWNRFNAISGSGVTEAPTDGKQYGRQDSSWTEIIAGSGSQVVPDSHAPVADFYLTGYDSASGSFSSGSVLPSGGSQVVPIHHEAVENYYLTGYDATDGSWTSAEVIAGSPIGYVDEVDSEDEDDRFLRVGGIYPHWEQETETCYSDFFDESVLTFSNNYPDEIQFWESQIELNNANHQINTIKKVVRGGFVYRISGTTGLSSGSVVIKVGDYSFPPIVPGSGYYSEAMTVELEAGNHYIIVYASGSATGILENFDLKPAYAYDVLSSGSISIPDAPTDGKLYARASGVWADFDVPKTAVPVEGLYLTGYNAVSGSFTSGSVLPSGGSQVVPVAHTPVENFYLTGYDAASGSFSSGSVVGGTSGSGGGASSFLDLTDTPSSYSGQAGKIVAVNSGGTGLEFVELSALLAVGFFLQDCYVSDVAIA